MALRILVVDDNQDGSELIGEALRMSGHEVTIAHDPLVALAQLAAANPEVALLDLGLPHMDGCELAGRIRKELPHCRLIALTGNGAENDLARTRAAGFDAHLVKPVALKDLMRSLTA